MWNQNFKRSKDAQYLPSQRTRWQGAAQKKLAQTGSKDQAERYANHATKSTIKRRQKKREAEKKKGSPSG